MSLPLQDGNDTGVADVVASLAPHFLRRAGGFALWQKTPRVPALGPKQAGHAWLAQHYKWGLDKLFQEKHSHAVIVEDDMLFSPGTDRNRWNKTTMALGNHRTCSYLPANLHTALAPCPTFPPADFLLYFEATAPLLDADPTLWCISAWNDNGFVTGHDWNVSRLFRTSYFPGRHESGRCEVRWNA
jgi:alpha-1,3-mannosyl-glycoprotein beta-1,2-N-acetylglucosaminyltransferase